MEASGFTSSEHDGGEGYDVWSDLETLKKLYGLLDKSTRIDAGSNIDTESNNEEILDHKSRLYLMKLLDEATQHTLTSQMKIFPGSPATHQLVNNSSIQRLGEGNNDGLEQNINKILRHSFQRRESSSKLFKSQFSIKSRQSQVHHVPTEVPSYPYHRMSWYNDHQSDINNSSKHIVSDMPVYRYHKEKSLCCPSEHSRLSPHEVVEMMPRRIGVSPKDQTNLTPSRVHLDQGSSQFKIQKNYQGPTQDFSGAGTTSSSESNSQLLDHRRISKFDRRAPPHKRHLSFDSRKKSGSYSSDGHSTHSNSVTSSSNCHSSSSSSKGGLGSLPIVPFRKTGKLPVDPFQNQDNLVSTARSKKTLISQHENNKSLQRIHTTRHHKFVNSGRNSKELVKKVDNPEKKEVRLKRLKDKLAIVFHHRHDHHHYHHHQTSRDVSAKGQANRENKDHRHRSPWKFLKGILHHSSEKTTEIVPAQQHHHRHMRALFHMLFGHLWGNKQRKKAQLGRTGSRVRVKKLHWWRKFGRGGHMKRLSNGKKARLRLKHKAN